MVVVTVVGLAAVTRTTTGLSVAVTVVVGGPSKGTRLARRPAAAALVVAVWLEEVVVVLMDVELVLMDVELVLMDVEMVLMDVELELLVTVSKVVEVVAFELELRVWIKLAA